MLLDLRERVCALSVVEENPKGMEFLEGCVFSSCSSSSCTSCCCYYHQWLVCFDSFARKSWSVSVCGPFLFLKVVKVRMKEKLTMKGARDRLWGRWRPALLFNHAGLCRIKIMSLLCLFLVALVVISRAASFMGWRHRLDSPQSLSRFLFLPFFFVMIFQLGGCWI